jgi:hypothetical protein
VPIEQTLATTYDTLYGSYTAHTMALTHRVLGDGYNARLDRFVVRVLDWLDTFATEPNLGGNYYTEHGVFVSELGFRDAAYRVAGRTNPVDLIMWTAACNVTTTHHATDYTQSGKGTTLSDGWQARFYSGDVVAQLFEILPVAYEEIPCDLSRLLSVAVSVPSDSTRPKSYALSATADSTRVAGKTDILAPDTARSLSKAASVTGDTDRPTSAAGSATPDTSRSTKVSDSAASDSSRLTSKAASATPDTLRQVSADNISRIYADTNRQVGVSAEATADARRVVGNAISQAFDSLRQVAANVVSQIIADSLRRVSKAGTANADSLRRVEGEKQPSTVGHRLSGSMQSGSNLKGDMSTRHL